MDSGVASSIAQHLKQQQSQIIRAWIDSVRDDPQIKSSRTLSEPELADHLPRLFDDLIDYLQNSGDEDSTKIVTLEARKHGNQRWRQGYQLTELLREIANIRRLIMVEGLSPIFRLRPEYSAHQDDGRDLIDQFFEN